MVFYSGKKLWSVLLWLPQGKNQCGLNGNSPQYLSRMRFSLTQTMQNSEFLLKLGLCRNCIWASVPGQEEMAALHLWGNSSWCLLAGVGGGAAALPAGPHPPGGLPGEEFLQQPTHRAAGEPPGRGESPASLLQKAARAVGACVMT